VLGSVRGVPPRRVSRYAGMDVILPDSLIQLQSSTCFKHDECFREVRASPCQAQKAHSPESIALAYDDSIAFSITLVSAIALPITLSPTIPATTKLELEQQAQLNLDFERSR
jgi:hypothetical protein